MDPSSGGRLLDLQEAVWNVDTLLRAILGYLVLDLSRLRVSKQRADAQSPAGDDRIKKFKVTLGNNGLQSKIGVKGRYLEECKASYEEEIAFCMLREVIHNKFYTARNSTLGTACSHTNFSLLLTAQNIYFGDF